MDTPGASIFQGTNIDINKSRNEEEEEDLEDQKRRKEEIQNLLMTKLDDFNYDESTINSSIISAISNDDIQNNYLRTENENEQYKVLFEVRSRELQTLREEFKNVTAKMTKQVDECKKKLLLTEAELEQLKVSYRNSEELLIDKSQVVKDLTAILESKEKQIREYVKNTEDLHLEIATYKSTIDGFHLQIQADKHPFGSSNKQFMSEEMKNAHKEQINKLESLLQEKNNYAKIIERENIALKEELNKLIDANTDNAKLIITLTKNFENAQKQCEDLIGVVETISNENAHLQERINNVYNESPNKRNSSNFSNLSNHVEKLKKMLVDKSVQLNTLNAKLQNYEGNLKELLEYRKLKSDVYQKEFRQCDNQDHTKNLILMQNDLQNYRRIIEDKNQQILNLNSTNKELLAKMEETLSQTRNDIQQFSSKYSLPQLEKMTEDLRTAQFHINELGEKLKVSEEKNSLLIQTNAEKEKAFKEELQALKLVTEKERNSFDNEIKKLQNELKTYLEEIKNYQQYIETLRKENADLHLQPKTSGNEDEVLKKQYLESQIQIKSLQENANELVNLKTIAEEQKCAFELEAKEAKNKLENIEKYLSNIERELENVVKDLQVRETIISELEETISSLKEELNKKISNENENRQELEHEKKTRKNLENEFEIAQVLENNEANLISLEAKLREEIQEEYFNKLDQIEKTYQKACGSNKNLNKEHLNKLKDQESKFREYLAVILNECTQKIKEFESNKEELIKARISIQNQFDEFKAQTNRKEEYFSKLVYKMQFKHKTEMDQWKLWTQKLMHSCLKIEATNKKTRDNILFKMQRYDSNVAEIEKKFEKIKKKINKK